MSDIHFAHVSMDTTACLLLFSKPGTAVEKQLVVSGGGLIQITRTTEGVSCKECLKKMSAPCPATCFLDVDGVLADFVGALQTRLNVSGPVWTYNLEQALGRPEKEIWSECEGFDFWDQLPKLSWADDVMYKVRSYFSRVCFLTGATRSPQCAAGKMSWLQRNYPGIPFLIGNKKHLVGNNNKVLIDDCEDHIRAWEETGGLGILFPADWNRLRGVEPMAYLREKLCSW